MNKKRPLHIALFVSKKEIELKRVGIDNSEVFYTSVGIEDIKDEIELVKDQLLEGMFLDLVKKIYK